MATEPLMLDKQTVKRGDEVKDTIWFFSNAALTTPLPIPDHDDIYMDLRVGNAEHTTLIKRISKLEGDIGIVDTNGISYTFGGLNIPARKYYTDIRLVKNDNPIPITLCGRVIEIIDNVTEITVEES